MSLSLRLANACLCLPTGLHTHTQYIFVYGIHSFANVHHAADVCEQVRVCLGEQCLLTADHPCIGHPRGGGYHGRWRADSSHFCHLLHGGYKCQLPRRQQEYALKAAACSAAIAAAECLPSNVHVSVVLLSLHGRLRYKQLSVILTVSVRLYGCDQPSALYHLFDFCLRCVADRVIRAFWHLFVPTSNALVLQAGSFRQCLCVLCCPIRGCNTSGHVTSASKTFLAAQHPAVEAPIPWADAYLVLVLQTGLWEPP